MSEQRIVIETLCEHEFTYPHPAVTWGPREEYGEIPIRQKASWRCPGGSRRVLTEGQYVLIEKTDGEWPDNLHYPGSKLWDLAGSNGIEILNALSGLEE